MPVLVLVLLVFALVRASRTTVQEEADAAGAWSPWELELKGLQCLQIDTAPFSAFKAKWPKCYEDAVKQGEKLGQQGNCRLCDLELSGSKPEERQSMLSTPCKAKVVCSAVRLGPSPKTCFDVHGKLAAVEGLNDGASARQSHPDKVCLPCPDECKVCGKVKGWVFTQRKFKCIVPAQGTADTGLLCEKPVGQVCGECEHRKCGGLMNLGCSRSDFKADCDYAESFANVAEQWQPPENYKLTVEAGQDTASKPEVLGILYQS